MFWNELYNSLLTAEELSRSNNPEISGMGMVARNLLLDAEAQGEVLEDLDSSIIPYANPVRLLHQAQGILTQLSMEKDHG